MSLADELLADLGSESEGDEVKLEGNGEIRMEAEGGIKEAEKEDVEMEEEAERGRQLTAISSSAEDESGGPQSAEELARQLPMKGERIGKLSRLMSAITPVLNEIRGLSGTYSSEKTYSTMIEANKHSVEIDNEIILVHKYIEENYSKRFNELASLVRNPVDYARIVRFLGNNLDQLEELAKSPRSSSLVDGATMMVITMAMVENKGLLLSDSELEQINEACDLVLELDRAKKDITNYVSQRISIYAPNLVQIVDAHTAAQLLAMAGGIKGLATTPATNLAALGANKTTGIGFGRRVTRRQGILYHSVIIQRVPTDKRTQAMRIVAGKLVLAARVDSAQSSVNNNGASVGASAGAKWRKEIEEKIEKLSEPPEHRGPKALKIPEDKPSKKRGGRRIRKMKEQWMQTDLAKAQNRMEFGKPEEEVISFDESVGLGMAGNNAGGQNIRRLAIDKRTRAKMSKSMQSRVSNASNNDSSNKSLASSLAFTAMQGIELVDPGRIARRREQQQAELGNGQGNKQIQPAPAQKQILGSHRPATSFNNGIRRTGMFSMGPKRRLNIGLSSAAKRQKIENGSEDKKIEEPVNNDRQ